MKFEVNREGLPCMWESGGGCRNTGTATVVCNGNGGPIKPLHIKKKGVLSNKQHAIFEITPGDYVVAANHHSGDFEVTVSRVLFLDFDTDTAETIVEHSFSDGEWDTQPHDFLMAAIDASMEKATCYHCREPHYAIYD